MRNLLFILCLFSAGFVFGQSTYNKFQWAPSPVLHAVDKKYEEAAAVYITDERINEYAIEKDGFFFYRTLHRIVHLNNDKGIEGFNKIYLPDDADVTMVDVKARTILPGGKIIEMDRNNIKDLKDDDGQYKIFALEGLTKGCEVEYYFTVKKDPSFFGREILASRVPSMKTSFKLIAPQHLFFETKSFNGLPASKESLANEKRWLQIDDEIDEALEEKYSNYQASLKQVEYKLCYNKARNATERLFTWNELAKKIYTIYSSFNDKDKKRIKELLDDIAPKGTETEKITAIENFMKKNFITRKDIPSDDTQDMGKVIKNKTASHKAICKLFTGLYTEAGINFQIVLAGDRMDYMVDRNFENWDNTQNFILYFPSTKKYLSPTDMDLRYPWIPPTWAETNGLFCVPTTIGNFTTAFGEIRYINQEASKYNFINLDIHLKLDKDDALVLDVKQSYGGYAASNYKYPFNFLPAEQQRDVLKQLIKFGTNSENMISHSFENREMEQADPYKPFVINASVKSTNLMEKAGDKLLLKVGELIGEQAEMYETKPRATEIDIAFPHVLDRVIELTIPEGYQVKNAQDLQIKEVYKEGNEETMGFVSSYVQNGNVMKITIHESYNRVRYPKLQYDAFKKIINASADFNKIVLILAKS